MRLAIACWLAVLALVCPIVAGAARSGDNGITSMTPTQIIAQVKQAVAGAKTVHIYGSGISNGKPIALDLKLLQGTGGSGHFAEGPLAFDIVRVGPLVYMKAGKKFWMTTTHNSSLATLFVNKWLSGSATKGDLAAFTPFTDIVKLTNQILSQHGKLEKGSTTTINGQPAIAIVDQTDGGTLYVATNGPAYPLLLKAGKNDKGQITFGDWNKPVTVTKPAHAIHFP